MISGDETLDEVVSRHNARNRGQRPAQICVAILVWLVYLLLFLLAMGRGLLRSGGGISALLAMILLHGLVNLGIAAWIMFGKKSADNNADHTPLWGQADSGPDHPMGRMLAPSLFFNLFILRNLFLPGRVLAAAFHDTTPPITLTTEEKSAAHSLLRRMD